MSDAPAPPLAPRAVAAQQTTPPRAAHAPSSHAHAHGARLVVRASADAETEDAAARLRSAELEIAQLRLEVERLTLLGGGGGSGGGGGGLRGGGGLGGGLGGGGGGVGVSHGEHGDSAGAQPHEYLTWAVAAATVAKPSARAPQPVDGDAADTLRVAAALARAMAEASIVDFSPESLVLPRSTAAGALEPAATVASRAKVLLTVLGLGAHAAAARVAAAAAAAASARRYGAACADACGRGGLGAASGEGAIEYAVVFGSSLVQVRLDSTPALETHDGARRSCNDQPATGAERARLPIWPCAHPHPTILPPADPGRLYSRRRR
jgi:hypothetical protein